MSPTKKAASELSIEDTGRGIPADKVHSIFHEKFTQASPSRDRKVGSGLEDSLDLQTRFLELHGGSIRVESEEGQGSRFILSIPASCIL